MKRYKQKRDTSLAFLNEVCLLRCFFAELDIGLAGLVIAVYQKVSSEIIL